MNLMIVEKKIDNVLHVRLEESDPSVIEEQAKRVEHLIHDNPHLFYGDVTAEDVFELLK